MNYEIEFELAFAFPVDQIDPGIDAGVHHPSEVRDVCPPLRVIVAEEVVALSWNWLEPDATYPLRRADRTQQQDLPSDGDPSDAL
jgi:hypothetical protein